MQLLLGPLLGRINDAVAVGISVRGWLLRRCCAKSKQNDQQNHATMHGVESSVPGPELGSGSYSSRDPLA